MGFGWELLKLVEEADAESGEDMRRRSRRRREGGNTTRNSPHGEREKM